MTDKITTIHLAHLPPEIAVHVVLVHDLKNATYLRQQLLDGNPAFEYALLDATTILSATHLLAAVFRAVQDMSNKRIKSRNVHSEIVFALSPNNNIAESFRKFGISDKTSDLVVVKVGKVSEVNAHAVMNHVERFFDGTLSRFDDESLLHISDVAKIRKIYKLNPVSATRSDRTKGDETNVDSNLIKGHERKEAEIAILGLMALRGAS